MAIKHGKYRYIFTFKNRGNLVDLHGKSIADFWNDIFDVFDLKGKLLVERSDGKEFTSKEVKTIFEDLLDNMMDDYSVISLNIRNLKTLEFINCYDGHLEELYNKIEEKGIDIEDKGALEKEGIDFTKATEDLAYKNLKIALEGCNELKLLKLAKNFKLNNPNLLNKPAFSELKRSLEYFTLAKGDKKNRFFYFYHIIDKVRKIGIYDRLLGMTKLKREMKQIRQIMNSYPIKGSRHEGGITS